MDTTTILLGAAALYALYKNGTTIDKIKTEFKQELQKVKADQEVTDTIIKAEQAKTDVLDLVKPVDFTGIVADYRASESNTDVIWYLRFQNKSNQTMKCIVKSMSVSINGHIQQNQQELYTVEDTTAGKQKIHPYFNVSPSSKPSFWKRVKDMVQVRWPFGSFGKDLHNMYGAYHLRDGHFLPARATVVYCVSNPVVNNGLPTEDRVAEIDGEVFCAAFLPSHLGNDPLLSNSNMGYGHDYPGWGLQDKIADYREKGRPVYNWYQ